MIFDAGNVVRKRIRKISRGGKGAATESSRMVPEKVVAAAEAVMILARGGGAYKVLKNYRKKIRANNRRLK